MHDRRRVDHVRAVAVSKLRIAAVAAIATALALAFGAPYGSSNQQTYLLEPLQRAFPELYQRDWFVATAHHYHVAFTYLVAPLYSLDARGVIALGVLQLALMLATYALIYALVAALAPRERVALFAGLAALLALGAGRALGGSYLFAGYAQPSSLAVVGWLVALLLWIRDRPLAAGLALALGGACHLNYALLGVGIFGAAELATHRVKPRRLAALLVPSLVVLVLFLPQMLASSHGDDPALALRLLVKFEFPGHFDPKHVRRWIWPLVAWLALAYTLRPRGERADRLWRFALVGSGACVLAVLVVSIPPLLTLTRTFVWRVAPIPQLAAQILVFTSDRPRLDRPRLALCALAAGVLVLEAFHLQPGPYGYVLAAALATLAFGRPQLSALLLAVALYLHRAPLLDPPPFDTFESDLHHWARTQTPTDAIFLAPPYANDFRLLARRAVVVDTKSPPMYAGELVAWYRRLCAVDDAPDLPTYQAAEDRWDHLTPDELVAAARHFDADFILIDKRSPARLVLPVAYEDASAIVYRTR